MSTGQFFAARFCAFRFATCLHKATPQKNCRLHKRYTMAVKSAYDPKRTLVFRMGERKNNRYMKTKEVEKDRYMASKYTHLHVTQGVENRLSHNSFLLKGWSVLLVSVIRIRRAN